MRETVHKVHGPVDGIDDPGRRIGQLDFLAFTRLFFADELVVRELTSNAVHQQLLDLLVGFGHEIRCVRLGLDDFPLGIACGDQLKATND